MGRLSGCNPCACWALKDATIVVGIWTFLYGLFNLGLFGWQTGIVKVEKERAASQRALWYGTLRRDDPRYPASYEQFYQTPEERFFLGLFIVQIIHLISDIFLLLSGALIIWAAVTERRFLLWPYFPAIIVSMLCSAAFCGVWFSAPKAPSKPAKLSTLKSIRDRIPYWQVMVSFELLMFLVNIYCFVVVIAAYRHIAGGSMGLVGYYLERKPKKPKKSKTKPIAFADKSNQKLGSPKIGESETLNFHLSEPGNIRKPLDPNLLGSEYLGGVPADPFPPAYQTDRPHSEYPAADGLAGHSGPVKQSFTRHWLNEVDATGAAAAGDIPPPDLQDFLPPPPTESHARSSAQQSKRKRRRRRRRDGSSGYTRSATTRTSTENYRRSRCYSSSETPTDSESEDTTSYISARGQKRRNSTHRSARARKSRSCYYDERSSSSDSDGSYPTRSSSRLDPARNRRRRDVRNSGRYRSEGRLPYAGGNIPPGPTTQMSQIGPAPDPEDPIVPPVNPLDISDHFAPSQPTSCSPAATVPSQGAATTATTITIPHQITIPANNSPSYGPDGKRKPKSYEINSEIVIKMPPMAKAQVCREDRQQATPWPAEAQVVPPSSRAAEPVYQTVAEAEGIQRKTTVV